MGDTRTEEPSIELPEDHPGFSDADYRARRAAIAAVGEAYRDGDPIPDVEYTPEEDEVWRVVAAELGEKHRRYACRTYLEAAERLALRTDRVPQLGEVSAALQELSGFRIRPVPGLVPTRVFYGSLADRAFLSTQYIRHHSVPFYTPEPDVIHELVGHCNMLASPAMADLYQLAGEASRRGETDEALDFFSRVFWFTLEFGVVDEGGGLRAYGAGLLSSFGEVQAFRKAEIRPWDIVAMGATDYDITVFQPVLFRAESVEQMVDDLSRFFSEYDDEAFRRLRAGASEEVGR